MLQKVMSVPPPTGGSLSVAMVQFDPQNHWERALDHVCRDIRHDDYLRKVGAQFPFSPRWTKKVPVGIVLAGFPQAIKGVQEACEWGHNVSLAPVHPVLLFVLLAKWAKTPPADPELRNCRFLISPATCRLFSRDHVVRVSGWLEKRAFAELQDEAAVRPPLYRFAFVPK